MEAFSGTFVVDVHKHEHDSFDQLFPATHQHQNLQEVSWREKYNRISLDKAKAGLCNWDKLEQAPCSFEDRYTKFFIPGC